MNFHVENFSLFLSLTPMISITPPPPLSLSLSLYVFSFVTFQTYATFETIQSTRPHFEPQITKVNVPAGISFILLLLGYFFFLLLLAHSHSLADDGAHRVCCVCMLRYDTYFFGVYPKCTHIQQTLNVNLPFLLRPFA